MSSGDGATQPQDGKGDHEPEPEKEKRVVKHTAKGLEMSIEKYQKSRGAAVKKAAKLTKMLKELMQSNDTKEDVKCHLDELIHLSGEARADHVSLLALPDLPEEEIERQDEWFIPHIDYLEGFMRDVHIWLLGPSEVELQSTHVTVTTVENEPLIPVQQENESQIHTESVTVEHVTVDNEPLITHTPAESESESLSTVDSDEVAPHDSVSNIPTTRSTRKSSASKASSSTSSARIKAQAEQAALMEQVAGLQQKHQIEEQQEQLRLQQEQMRMQQEKLRREKEQVEMETQLAAAIAKTQVLEAMSSRSTSKVSNGTDSYMKKGAAAPKEKNTLHPNANTYIPDQPHREQNMSKETKPPQQPVVRPKQPIYGKSDRVHYTTTQMQYSLPRQTPSMQHPPLMQHMQTENVLGQNVQTENVLGQMRNVQSESVLDQMRNVQTEKVPGQMKKGFQGHTVHTSLPVTNVGKQGDIYNVLQKQNDITSLLVKQNLYSTLPPRDIPIYEGDPLQYEGFIRAFENTIEKKTDDFGDCIYFLEQYTRGHPKNLVRSCQHLPPSQGYPRAKHLLKENFGNEHKIATAYMEKAFAWATIKPEDAKGLEAFSLFLRSCCNAMENLSYMDEMNVASNMRTILLKLPYKLRDIWRNRACDLKERGYRPMFSDLVKFIERQVMILSDPLFGNIQDPKQTSNVKPVKPREKSCPKSNFATTVTPISVESNGEKSNAPISHNPCLFCKKSDHTLEKCAQIMERSHREKIGFLKEKGICFGCLKRGHLSKFCRARITCDTCKQKHPDILHFTQKEQETKTEQAQKTVISPHTCGHIRAGDETSIFSIVPVQVKSHKGDTVLQTYAFLDHGSTSTFCTENLMKRLKITGQRTNILLRTMNQVKPEASYHITGLEIARMDSNDFMQLPDVFTHTTMPVSQSNIPKQQDLSHWPYLNHITLPEIDSGIDLLIGTNASKLLEPWEVVNSQADGPYAVRTLLGWVIYGPLREDDSIQEENGCPAVTVNRISIQNLEELLVKQYNQDFSERASNETEEMSREEARFLDILKHSAKMKDGHYCLNLPFKQDDPIMPNNRCIAEQRIQSLKRKFNKSENFHDEYTSFLTDMINTGYAELVPEDELNRSDGKLWYIPHHGVYHSKKGTLRVVFDCGAVYKGTSLNCQLLQGPDLTNSLIGVLTRFRQEPIALMADIKAMFHQVKVSENHVDYLRFLWWPDGDVQKDLAEYRMKVHLFGAVSSPSCANFALRKTAEDNQSHFPSEVTDTVNANFYVDDALKSISTEQKAVKLVKDLTALCQRGGFILSKWISNSRAVLTSIPHEHRAKEIKELDLDKDNLPVERALGLHWCVETDVFKFTITARERPHTRRGILSVVGSIYDPLGFLTPFALPAKMIMQELCRRKLGWDEAIPGVFSQQWTDWLADLKQMAEFKVDRCIKPKNFGQITHSQLHHFSDASESGYGTVSYLRLENGNGEVHVSFMMGKSRVAPLKQMTIPRMELAAAVLAVRVDKMLRKELQLPLDKSMFWTDSTTVLKYISNENKRFQTFVANRISLIRDATDVTQWKYVGTKENPADAASRGLTADRFLSCKKWIRGPDFLYKENDKWPNLPFESTVSAIDPEVKPDITVNVIVKDELNPTNYLIHYFSSWMRLKTAVAWLLKVKNTLSQLTKRRKEIQAAVSSIEKDPVRLKEKVEKEMQAFKTTLCGQCLTPADLIQAEHAVISFSQMQKFPEEISVLQTDKNVKRNSHLYKLDPVLDGGLLRVGGRLSRLAMPEEIKHPIILSKDLHISTLLLRHIHKLLGHGGRNFMLSHLRKKYWIIKANSAARKIITDCTVCKRQRGRVGEQKMADLPLERIQPDKPPFTDVGVDYFGPIEIKRGRSVVKRYGVIFTCMASRAVHLEVAHTLDTDSCIHALRRFICRRGQVTSLRSDNGTNLVGAERELKEALKGLNQDKIQNAMLQQGIKWNFNPPAGSHHGGVWERLIRMVRNVLRSVLKQQMLDEEGLQTLMCEVEAILNDRPLTKSSDDPMDLEALTPNHLLLLKTQPILPPGLFAKDDLYIKRRWKQAQYMADLFWKRWIKEYLPLIQERQRWSAKKRSFAPGDIVVVVDPTAPRGSWLMGRILDIMPDARGLVRSVRLKTKSNILERPITKICLLQESEL